MSKPKLTIALAGNPNAGKTSLFNALTGARQHVANWPGVTVERKEGFLHRNGTNLHIIDLPGTYSLTPYSTEEIVTRNFLLQEPPDVVVHVIDSSNLERNLYLTTQLLDLGVPLVLAFNMSDAAEAAGYRIDCPTLSKLLGAPIVRTVASRNQGMDALVETILQMEWAGDLAPRVSRVDYGGEIEPHVAELARRLEAAGLARHARWSAVKLLEGDKEAERSLRLDAPDRAEAVLAEARRLRKHIEHVCGQRAEIVFADRRYGFIAGACAEAVRPPKDRRSRSDRIDAVVTNRWLGLPIFAAMMYLVFQLTFLLGNPLVDLLDAGKERLATAARGLWPGNESMAILRSLLADGVIEGVGAVLVFVPLIVLLYLAIAILEDSGYMARAAFVLDRQMHRIGLHGKSFIPMLIGFGCTVPAIMATRIIETRRDRLTTMLVLPLVSCGARLPVYVLLLGAFFPARALVRLQLGSTTLLSVTNQALLLFAIYLIGIALAVLGARILRATIFRGENTPLVMELPPFRRPTVAGLAIHVWERSWLYIRKAGTIILAIVIVLWAMKTWPGLSEAQKQDFAAQRAAVTSAAAPADAAARLKQIDLEEHSTQLDASAIGRIGHDLAPVLRPCGFDWKIATALLGSFAAKEAFVGQMGVIYAVGDDAGADSLRRKLSHDYTPLQGFCIMLFVLIASPCMATAAVTARESGSWKWAALQWTWLTLLAWTLTTAVFQTGRLFGLS